MTREERAAGRGRGMGALIPLALTGLLLLVGYGVLHSSSFRYERIELEGAGQLRPAQVEQILGLIPGDMRWRHPAPVLRQRLLRREPWVANAQMEWRGSVLWVQVQERRPVALIPYYNLYAVVDDRGVVLAAAPLDEYQLPVITGIFLSRALRGERVQHPDLPGALEVAALVPPSVADQVSEVHVTGIGELQLILEGPVTVYLGPPERLEEKLATLPAVWENGRSLLEEARARGYDLDLRNPDRPTLKPRA